MARHTHLTGGFGNGTREDCPQCQQAQKIATDAAAARGDDATARVDEIIARIDRLRLQYVTPFSDGRKITDDESFVVDVIADVLVFAGARNGDTLADLETALDSALRHAREELNAYPAAMQIEAETPHYEIDGLQAVEPEELPRDQGITVYIHAEPDGMGFSTVTVSGPDRDALVEYVRDQWGDEDAEWFAEHVVARVRPINPR